jgi:hypothetical protein
VYEMQEDFQAYTFPTLYLIIGIVQFEITNPLLEDVLNKNESNSE